MKLSLFAVALGLAVASSCALAAARGAAPNDAQIAAIVVAANQADIDAGKLAQSRSKTKDVQDFGQSMVSAHTDVNKSAVALVKKLHVTPESNPTSESLKKGGEENVASLRKLSGPAFDKAYIDHEVAYHQSVIDALDNTLIPNAQNAELKALLVKVRPAFVAHLAHAKMLQESLGKSGS